MPFDYHDSSAINTEEHNLTLTSQDEHTLDLNSREEHVLSLETPILGIDYDILIHKPKINDVELQGDLSLHDLGIQPEGDYPDTPISSEDIDVITGYVTTLEAFHRVLENSDEVHLDEDFVFEQPINITKDFILDLNEHQIDFEANDYLLIVDACTLTINGPGTINSNYRIGSALNGAEIIINGGTYNAVDLAFTTDVEDSHIIVNGGTINDIENL